MPYFRLLVACMLVFFSALTNAQAQEDTVVGKATFAGGCFWCMEPQFEDMEGVQSVVVGYTGGTVKNPTYQQVSAGNTGHLEAIEVTYDPELVSYDTLLDVFWANIDPLDAEGQFCDKGSQYRAAIFYHGEAQHEQASASRNRVAEKLGAEVATLIEPAQEFYAAEDYHQEFYIKNSNRYKSYKKGCGRDERLKEIWQDETAE
jgi:peptide-methionine (S)-S-oxide reductase